MKSLSLLGKVAKMLAATRFIAVAMSLGQPSAIAAQPNIVLVMADDQGWGQMGYYDHPVLKTPNLDSMAANGLRFDRFYAGAPNCSPTRATVLTGRSNDRTGVNNHGYALRRQEKTLPRALQEAGYATGHFGKWHLNGYRGPGAPVLIDDPHHPGHFGFDEWLSVTNFFDRDPVMSRKGTFEEFKGDSSEIIVDEALKFIGSNAGKNPFFVVIWYGTPHSPFMASDEDREPFGDLPNNSAHHYGELVAMDRSIGTLRRGLRQLKIADETLFWYCSDNGGLSGIKPETVGGLRGFKNSVYEGGLRVPSVIEWPEVITEPRMTSYPAATMDIFPTIADIVGLPASAMLQPSDGTSIRELFVGEIERRKKPIPFRHTGRAALIDNHLKLLTTDVAKAEFQLFNLKSDPQEQKDIADEFPSETERLVKLFQEWNESVEQSVAGKDYPEGQVDPRHPEPRVWANTDEYRPYFEQWKDRPEYKRALGTKKR